MFYTFIKWLARILLYPLYPSVIRGQGYIPPEGGCILVSNHRRLIDPVLLGGYVRRRVVYLAKMEIVNVPVLGTLFRWYGYIAVNRKTADLGAMRKCFALLERGGMLGIFPEGHRYKSVTLGPLEDGAGMIALRARCPIVPLYFSPYRLFRPLYVRFGPPLDLSDLHARGSEAAAYAQATQRIQDALLSLAAQCPKKN